MPGEPTGPASTPAPTTRRRTLRKRTWFAIGGAALFLTASIATALILNQDEAPTGFLELYITDLPADFTRFDVRIAAVEYGPQRTPLELDHRDFDLLSLRGPEDALRIARGQVPADESQEVYISFESGVLELDHKKIPVQIPDAVLTVGHDYGLAEGALRSVLFDINVDDSLTIDGAEIRFEPVVQSVYIVAEGSIGSSSRASKAPEAPAPKGAADFTSAKAETPQKQALQEAPKEQRNPFGGVSPTPSREPTAVVTTTVTATPDKDPDPEQQQDDNDTDDATDDWMPNPGDAFSTVPDYAGTMLGWFIQYAPNTTDMDQMKADIERAGGEIIYRFESLPALYVAGQEVHVANLTRQTWAEYIEPVVPLSLHLSSSKPAIRAPELYAALTEVKDAAGRPIDGRGVGIAVVDSGIDGLHPDLTHFLVAGDQAAVRANFKVVSNNLADMINTDTTSGHGTHVAGIAAGRGTKDPSLKGVAPAATLYGFGVGELANTFWSNQAFDWIVTYGQRQNPPIRVVTNSWGTTGTYDPNSLTTKLVNQMVAKGMVVVFSAGNKGDPNLDAATTSPECQIPTPGVLCVSWYDDQGGSRNGVLHDKSSRGARSNPTTWPDISAPGSAVRSARTPFGWVTGVGLTDYYVTLEGTSMAAPHVAGATALLLQTKPNLTPAQVDLIVKTTAHKYTDAKTGAYNAAGSNHARGYGLLDAYAAVQVAKSM